MGWYARAVVHVGIMTSFWQLTVASSFQRLFSNPPQPTLSNILSIYKLDICSLLGHRVARKLGKFSTYSHRVRKVDWQLCCCCNCKILILCHIIFYAQQFNACYVYSNWSLKINPNIISKNFLLLFIK